MPVHVAVGVYQPRARACGEREGEVVRRERPRTTTPSGSRGEVDLLKGTEGVGISIDFVATRDTHPGD